MTLGYRNVVLLSLALAACHRAAPHVVSPPKTDDTLGRMVITATSQMGRRPAEPTWTADQVDSAVQVLPGGAQPRYPDSLRVAAVTGLVRARFVVDRMGRPDMATFQVVESTRPEFASAVLTAVPGMKYSPARKGGQEVRQVVQQTFEFAIAERRRSAP